MAVILKGIAVVWGCGNLTMTGVTISSTTGKMQNFDFNRDSEVAGIRDPNGHTAGKAYYDAKRTLTINVIPFDATTIATAITNMLAMLPAPGTNVTPVDSDGVDTAIEKSSGHSGVYVCQSSSLNRSNDGPASISMVLEMHDDNDLSVTAS